LTIVLLMCLAAGCGRGEQRQARPAPRAPQKQPAQTTAGQPARSAAPANTAAEDQAVASHGERGRQLYAQHCAGCHGEKGNGQALAGRYLFPRPRDFRAGRFRLVSTVNGIPTLDDIETVIARGMPGSAMPPWPGLSESDRRLLAEQVIEFRREGIRDAERKIAAEIGEEVDPADLEEIVGDLTTPGPPVAVPALAEPTAEAVARGKQLYMTRGCASCHGPEGRGDGQQNMVDAEGLPARARDLTRGLFKGSPDPASVYRRILAGMPGSPMPASQQITPEQVADLAHYVLSLSDEETRSGTVLNRERIVARRVATIEESLDGSGWDQVTPVAIRLVPLWWRDESTPSVAVQAMHDGKSLALRLGWIDAQPDLHSARSEAFEDAVGVGISREETFLGMGVPNAHVDLWFWDADRQHGTHDVGEENPRIAVDIYPLNETVVSSPEYARAGTATAEMPDLLLPPLAVGNQIAPKEGTPPASALQAAGPGTVTFRPPLSQLVQAHGEWNDGGWTVVMTRDLDVGDEANGVSLRAGEDVSLVLAVWEGARRDRDGQKLISIWQDFLLEK
jgi:mono/diheme cytochrome c family protein